MVEFGAHQNESLNYQIATLLIGNSGNVIYINPEKSIVVAVASYFKPTIFDRVDFIQEYIEPFISEI